MAYMALYRKHRSKTFDELVGQEHITRTLKNQIINNKIAHAYLFCGIRGIGKTSIAKILGKAVNCENPEGGNPCLTCPTCQGIANESMLNVVEIDAASNTGVDDIRNLRDDALYMPATGKYKVYVIDEVHMLSKSAFNALLKILEEPPKHVIFILATTEAQKIPATILSRCQRFDLKRISKDSMKNRMREYVAEENVNIEDKALEYIAELSEGSMRDALSILEQIISIKEGEVINLEDVLDVLGNVDYSIYNDFTIAIKNKEIKKAVGIINDVYDSGKDIVSFASMYCAYLRNLILMGTNADVSLLDMSEENAKMLKEVAKDVNTNDLIILLEEFLKVEKEMKYSSMPKLALEVLTIRLCKVTSMTGEVAAPSSAAASDNNSSISNANSISSTSNESINTNTVSVPEKKEKPRIANKVDAISEGDIEGLIAAWNAIVDATKEMTVRLKLAEVEIIKLEGNDVYMTAELANEVECVEKFKARLEKALPTINGQNVVIHIALAKNLEEAVKKVNNTPKIDDTKLDDLTAQFAKSGVEVNIE